MGVTDRTAERAPLSVKNMPMPNPAMARITPTRATGNASPPNTKARDPLIESGNAALCAVNQLSSDSRVYFVRIPAYRFRLIRPSAQRNATTQVTTPAITKNTAGKSNRVTTHPPYACIQQATASFDRHHRKSNKQIVKPPLTANLPQSNTIHKHPNFAVLFKSKPRNRHQTARPIPKPQRSETAQTYRPPKEGFSLKSRMASSKTRPVDSEAEPNLQSVKSFGVPACGVDDCATQILEQPQNRPECSLRFHRRGTKPSAYLL